MKILRGDSLSALFRRRTPTFIIDPGEPGPELSPSGKEGPRREGRIRRVPRLGADAIGAAFTPTQPKAGRRQLVGRGREQARIVQALLEDRAHVVLYSERGRGKTSLANCVMETLRRSGVMVGRYTCDATTTYDELVRGAVRDLPASLLAIETARHSSEQGCGSVLPAGPLQPRDVVVLPDLLDCQRLVLVVDEFDRVLHGETRTRLADTIKQLSDRSVPLQFLILGVSDNLEQILGQHPSIKRAIFGVHLRLFEDAEIAEMIDRACRQAGFAFPAWMVERVVRIARGMPHMAQLLGLRITQAAAERGNGDVNQDDYVEAIERLIADASPDTHALYGMLTGRGSDQRMVHDLRRIALASNDPWGRIVVREMEDGSAEVGGTPLRAGSWVPIKTAKIVAPIVQAADLWAFADRAVLYHTLLLAERDGMCRQDALSVDLTANRDPERPLSDRRVIALQRG